MRIQGDVDEQTQGKYACIFEHVYKSAEELIGHAYSFIVPLSGIFGLGSLQARHYIYNCLSLREQWRLTGLLVRVSGLSVLVAPQLAVSTSQRSTGFLVTPLSTSI